MLLQYANSLLRCLICPTFLAGLGLPALLPGPPLSPLTPPAGEHPGAGTALPLVPHGSPWARASQAQTGTPTSSQQRARRGKGFARSLRPVRECTSSPSPGERGLMPKQQRLLLLAQRSPREQRGRLLSNERTDLWELPSEQATCQHIFFPLPMGEKRGQETKTVHLYQDCCVYVEGAKPRRTRPRGSWAAASPRSRCGGGQPAPSAATSHRRSRSHQPSPMATWISSSGHTLPIMGVPEQARTQQGPCPSHVGSAGLGGSCGTQAGLCRHGEKGRLSRRRPAS